MADVVTTDEGDEVDFDRRREPRPVRVIPVSSHWKAVLAVAAALGISFGGMTVWAARAFVREEISVHSKDSEAHVSLVRRIEAQAQFEDTRKQEILRLTGQIEALQREVRETRELVVELRTILRRQGRER